MPGSPFLRPRFLVPATAVLLVAAGVVLWLVTRPARLPGPDTQLYRDYVEAFQAGTARLDVELPNEALEHLTNAVELIPQEPAGWANRGLVYLRTNQLARAAEDIGTASRLAPGDGTIEEMLAYLAERQGQLDAASEHFEKALKSNPADVHLLYKLSKQAEKKGDDEEQAAWLEKLLAQRPTGLPILVERLQLAVRRGDRATEDDTVARFKKLSPDWQERTRAAFNAFLEERGKKPRTGDFEVKLSQFGNVLKAEHGYSRVAVDLDPNPGQVGHSVQQFLRLEKMRLTASAPDLELKLTPATLPNAADAKEPLAVVVPAWLSSREPPVVLAGGAEAVRCLGKPGLVFEFPSGEKKTPPTANGILVTTLYQSQRPEQEKDYRSNVVLAGAGGLRFYQQSADGGKRLENGATKLPASVLTRAYHGVWAADVDIDGDLDLVLAPADGEPVLLQNNFDGTWAEKRIFPGVKAPRGFVWADLDNDGAPDAALLDADGGLHVFMNERAGQFRRRPAPDQAARYAALCAADVNDDGVFDLIACQPNGGLVRLSDRDRGRSWDTKVLGTPPPALPLKPGETHLQAIDLDLNGTLDAVLRTPAGGAAWLSNDRGEFTLLPERLPPGLADVVSLDEKGQFDVLGVNGEKKPTRHTVAGTRGYGWYTVRCRANPKGTGDQRVNDFAIGSEAEVRTGTLVTKQLVNLPVVHFGLGDRGRVHLNRFVWTNGALQYEFEKPANTAVVVEQRLKGSCPFLFTHDGEKVVFVTDFCWSTPLGLYINSQKRGGGFAETTEWVKVPGEKLAPRGGVYDVRVQANLWETDYLDHLSLVVVDHPPETDVFADERFFLTPTKPRLYLTSTPKPVRRALDARGKDVTETVARVDGKYLDVERGAFQGAAADHWVEVDLPEGVPDRGPVYLLARGWLQPTDSSVNVALEQAGKRPQPLSLEVPDGDGGWKTALPALGFPAGKNKTMVIRLDGAAGQPAPRRFRLRTSMEIYWDALHWAEGRDEGACKVQTLLPDSAELRYRGILRTSRASRNSPEIPDYEVVTTRQIWRDLIGYHTRFGDVRELVVQPDGRYVMMNAGDEIGMTFRAPPPPPAGWKRDFVWVSDGWTKDGDLNTRFGKTVLPLPARGRNGYDTPPASLEEDPVYRRHPKDWQVYHTRYVTPAQFELGLRTFRRPQPPRETRP